MAFRIENHVPFSSPLLSFFFPGIPNDSVGISRRHVEVVRVCNLDPPSGLPRRQQEQPSQETQLSQQSVSSVSSRPRRRPPYASK